MPAGVYVAVTAHPFQPHFLEPEPRPVRDDQLCKCRHPRWMHAEGRPQTFCHFTGYGGDAGNRCRCRKFVRDGL